MSKSKKSINMVNDVYDKLANVKRIYNKNHKTHKTSISKLINVAVLNMLNPSNNQLSMYRLPDKKATQLNDKLNKFSSQLSLLQVNLRNYTNNVNQLTYNLNVLRNEKSLPKESIQQKKQIAEKYENRTEKRVIPILIKLLTIMCHKIDYKSI